MTPLMIRLVTCLPALYVIARTLWPLPLPLPAKLCIALALVGASQYHLWSRLSSGSPFAPEFPRPVVILFNWAFGAIFLLAMLQLALDLAALASLVLAALSLPGGGWAVSDRWRVLAVAAATLSSASAVGQALRVPPAGSVEVTVAGLPASFDGYGILQLSDLHISRLFPARWAQAVVERANAVGADLIAVTGDFIDGSVAMRRADVEPLRGLRAREGVLAVPGNHEYFFSYDAWAGHLAGMGISILGNGHAVIRRGDDTLAVAGVTDRSAPASGHPGPDLDAALAGIPEGTPIVLLDHRPGGARRAAARGVALQLSGHTHGGMILGLDRLVALANGGFVSGSYPVDGMRLHVSNGTGLWPGFALRLGRPSEMTRFVLRRPADL